MSIGLVDCRLLALSFAVAALHAAPVHARTSVVGSWLGTIEGEAATRSLIVSEEAPTPDGALLSARYGISSQGMGPIVARVVGTGEQRQLLLTTQADSRIAVTEQPDGSWKGTFTLKSGNVRAVTFVRTTEEALKQLLAKAPPASVPAPLIQPPAPDVPPDCAAFSGAWGGEWPVVGYASLWVLSIDAKCTAKVIYPAGPRMPSPTQPRSEAPIDGRVLVLKRPDGGTTSFELSGDAINATYSGPSGINRATLRKIDADPAALARVDAELRAARAMVPLAADLPPACAAFHGQWVGSWSQGSDSYLRVVEVKMVGDKCTARYSYSSSKNPLPARDTAEVARDAMSFICNSATGGTCVFVRDGAVLRVSYTNPSGGTNSGLFKRIE